ncbi:hypothetical protein DI09_60p60 [Mitosporidium daphniae]|uniref:C2H2-type domain-containing protein n=1 Tax=Mitosporidium daphniae TaxID=1485682 RepID=A0A098VP96_9MICR|nr:uncharacterized protein DI09_60p60 [Mitosporidium daphniae]KGG50639.1 hypothetical protein DI09_60p60 [Mitosporidium daphniae]|eukprot:XP_013237083.1 uncharacterized protein DI09_60p60 [Mitosporidium daphniae]
MGTGKQSKKRKHVGIKDHQIHEDLAKQIKATCGTDMKVNAVNESVDATSLEELPGCGEFLCIECSRYFTDGHSLDEHRRSKIHKRRHAISTY